MVPVTTEIKPAAHKKRFERIPDPCGIVIFGASGDLAKRKIVPALFDLSKEGLLPERAYIVGFARSEMDDASFRAKMGEACREFCRLKPEAGEWEAFAERITYFRGDYKDPKAFAGLGKHLEGQDSKYRLPGAHLFYLSTPPEVYADVARLLGGAGLSHQKSDEQWVRLVVEKPFGRDLESAKALARDLLENFQESQIYRIDHYLGKETVQNLMVFRFANAIFEPLWNRNHIDHVQITSAEAIGIEDRAGYYESAGAMRDMFQNHMLQLVSLVAMEAPSSFDATSVRSEKAKVMRSIHQIPASSVERFFVRGQYGPGSGADGKKLAGYLDEPGVAPNSSTETYIASRLLIDNWRWSDVPFYVRSAKRMPRRASEISIVFKRVPHMMFKTSESLSPNVLKIIIQPNEGITLSFEAKSPGQAVHLQSVLMDFRYSAFGVKPIEAYERLIMDCMLGDQTLFDRSDSVEAAWTLVQPALDYWKENPPTGFPNYAAGTWGPADADDLIGVDGHRWRNPGETF